MHTHRDAEPELGCPGSLEPKYRYSRRRGRIHLHKWRCNVCGMRYWQPVGFWQRLSDEPTARQLQLIEEANRGILHGIPE